MCLLETREREEGPGGGLPGDCPPGGAGGAGAAKGRRSEDREEKGQRSS